MVVLVLAAGAIWFGVELFEPFTGSGHGSVVVVVPRGAGASEVGNLLASRGVVASAFFFNLYAAIEGDRGELHSGQYVLRRGMSYSAALDVLTKPPAPPPVVRVVIPEGDSRRVIAGLARADGLAGELPGGVRALTAARAGALRRAAEHPEPRGLPVPGDVRPQGGRERERARRRTADRVPAERRPLVRGARRAGCT